jgi:hypothetical protein
VALCYYQTIPKQIRLDDKTYLFSVRANICLAWVEERHVDRILQMKRTDCACASGKKVFRYANENDVRRWTNGGGR